MTGGLSLFRVLIAFPLPRTRAAAPFLLHARALTERDLAYASGCTCATWARRPLPCSSLRQCLHRTLRNSRGLLFGFLAQWCLSCSLTPLAVKRRRQNLHFVSLGDGAFISDGQSLNKDCVPGGDSSDAWEVQLSFDQWEGMLLN